MNPLSRLMKKADGVARSAGALIAETIRGIRGELANLADELNLAGSASAREEAYAMIRKRYAATGKRLDRVMRAANEYAAESAAREAEDMTGMEVKYSAKRAEAICELVTPAQGENLAAVFTDKMAKGLIDSLREATVGALREQAVSGGTLKEVTRTLAEKWKALAKVESPTFTDASGRKWNTETYFQMNARTSAMRI